MPLPSTAHARQPWTAPTVAPRPSRRRHPDDPLPPSERESAVWRLVAYGHTTTDIARELGTSANTVKNQVEVLKTKLGVRTAAELGRLYGEQHPPEAS